MSTPLLFNLQYWFSRPKPKFWWHYINWFIVYFIFCKDLLVTNLQKFTRYKFIIYRSKALPYTGRGLSDPRLTLILNNVFFHKTYKAATLGSFLTFTSNNFTKIICLSLPSFWNDDAILKVLSSKKEPKVGNEGTCYL